MTSPFPLDTRSALYAHSSFTMSAWGVGVRRITAGKPAPCAVSAGLQTCNNVPPVPPSLVHVGAETPREKHRMPCPHCEHPAVIRTSTQMSRITRELTFCCTNPECGHTFVALLEVVRTLSPSATPDPTIALPLSTHVRRDMLRAQVDHAASAAHAPVFTRPVTGDLFGGLPPPKPA